MQELIIQINWEYFLGIIVGIFAVMISAFSGILMVAYKGSARFTALETSMEWVKDTLKAVKIAQDNEAAGAFSSHSPVDLNQKGEAWLIESELKNYIENHKTEFITTCEAHKETNPYEVQKYIFKLFDEFKFEEEFENKLKAFAYEKGTTMEIIRRVGAIHLRNLCLKEFGMKSEDIDAHDPAHK